MKCGARVAMGVVGGYFLGRTKKMKLALMLGGMAAGQQMGGPGQILGQATKKLGQSPELAALTDQMRGRLLEAGKGAAVAVATRQVEALTDRVGRRVEDLADVPRMADRPVRRAAGVADLDALQPDEDYDDEDDFEDEDLADEVAADEELEDEPTPVRRTRSRASSRRSGPTSSGQTSGRSRSAGTASRSSASKATKATKAAKAAASTGATTGRRSSARSSSSGAPKAARSASSRSKANTPTAKKTTTSSSRTPKKAASARKASRTTPIKREGRNG